LVPCSGWAEAEFCERDASNGPEDVAERAYSGLIGVPERLEIEDNAENDAGVKAGIPDMTYRALRRTFATQFQRHGSPKELKQFLWQP
jgi:hypothetical protein